MARHKPFYLFAYGTMMSPSIFRQVLGRRLVTDPADADGQEAFLAREAVLSGYRKISPDSTYVYAVPDPQGRIHGCVIGPLGPECMPALLHYEGKNYRRRSVRVTTKDGVVQAVVFIANTKELEHSFGYQFRDPLKQEILLRQKIDNALLEAEREQLHTEERTARRAVEELHGNTIRDLVRRHFDAGGISDYAIRHSIKDEPLRDFRAVAGDPEAEALAPNYLSMVVRQVIFNQIEEHIRRDFRYELESMKEGVLYYDRSISSVATLRMLNAETGLMDILVGDCLNDLRIERDHLVDYVQWAVRAADVMYDPSAAASEIKYIRSHMSPGYIPLGAELEFSNIGHDVIDDPAGTQLRDTQFDGFLYFPDFGLDVLTWKLGGHIDDHHQKFSQSRRRGFFEVALGNLSVQANISRPITADPWLLSQFIQATRRFYHITPHSVHISLQLRTQARAPSDRPLPLYVMKCLFALAGDPVRGVDGRVRIHRLASHEIITPGAAPAMLFSEVRKRYTTDGDDSYPQLHTSPKEGRYVQQFRFLRLRPDTSYEPVVLALKGIQLSLVPGSFLTAAQYARSRDHRKLFDRLVAWGTDPKPISDTRIQSFLRRVQQGLMSERRGKPAHSEAYIAWSVAQLRRTLRAFNAALDAPRGSKRPRGGGRNPMTADPHPDIL